MKFIIVCAFTILITFALCFLLDKFLFEFVVSTDLPQWFKYILLR